MKTVIVLRHAKAEGHSHDGRDLTRPLTDRGRKDAGRVGKFLRKLELVPDVILCSPSTRTRETIECLLEKLRHDVAVAFEESIYEASTEALVRLIAAQTEGERILLVGHNPGVERLVSRCVGRDDSPPIHMPTAGVARIDWDSSHWDVAEDAPGQLVWLTNPEMLRDL